MAKVKLTQDKAKNSPAGGVVVGKRNGQTMIYDDASVGGYFVGKTHKEGGIQMINKSTGQPLEVQGSEVIITAPAVADQTKREFEGKMMTNREILSAINEKGGGVAFASGGDIPKKIKRTGASYKYGGKTMTDHEIYKYITGGGIAEDFSIRDIANIHQVPLAELKEEVRIGMIAESEHKSDKKEQMEIVKDHLLENPKYYTLLKKAGLVEENTAPLEKTKWLKQFYVTNNPSIDKLLKDLQPKINELIEKQKDLVIKESTRIFGEPRPMSELDIEFYEAGLLFKMVQAFNKYLKNTDELYDVSINKRGSLFEVNGKVKRDGRTYKFDTELIDAGGYNIQEYHYRYIIKTDLPSSNENSAVENIKAKMGVLKKIRTVDEDIARYLNNIKRLEQENIDGFVNWNNQIINLSTEHIDRNKRSIIDYSKEIEKLEVKKDDLVSVFESLDKKGFGVNFGKQVKEAIGRKILVDRLQGSKYKETGDTLDFKIESRFAKDTKINTFSFVDEGNGLCTMKAGLELRGKYTPYAEYKNLPIKEIPYKINEIFNGDFSKYLEYEDGGEVEKALNDLEKAPSVKFWNEPEFQGESYFFDKEGEPNSFVSLQEDDISKTILAYDEDGQLVGVFRIRTSGDLKGAFKIVVREDAMRKGWGKKLLDEAEKQNIDIVGNVKNNSFSSRGRDLLRSWLNEKSKQYKKAGLEDGGGFEENNFPDELIGNDNILFVKEWEKNQNGKNIAHYNIYWRGNDIDFGGRTFESVKSLKNFKENYILSNNLYDKLKHQPEKQISNKYNQGGQTESLVRDAKSGNTPARDLNNYNDVLDIDADGVYGAETGLYADGGMMKKGGLIAPNGNKSNLTPEQYKLVRTPEFKAWFGDWENDPENSSKVIDENGEPLVVYHGSNSDFNQFLKEKIWSNIAKPSYDAPDGFYFAKNELLANKYGKILKPFFIGKKGVLLNNSKIVVCSEPTQIKLADGTNTKFDNMNPDIRYADGGDVKPYDANMEGDSADMMFAEGGAVSSVVDNWDEVPSIWKNTSKVKKVAFTNSPYDKGLYSIVAPFLGNDDLRPIMSGINFDENGITVTDAHKLITLPYPSKEFEGIYEADLSKRVNPEQITISGKYPNYAPIIPESKNTVKYEVDVYKLLQYTNVAIKYANKTTYAVNYKIYDEIIGFNANYLNQVLTTLLKLGHDKVYGHFVGYTKAFIFSPQKDYELGNDDILLLMPLVTDKKFYGAEDMLYGNNRKLSVYYDFNDNEIHNADNSIAEFKMTYENNSVISKEDVNLLQKLANGKNRLPILDYVKVKDGIARASDLDSEYYLSGVSLPDGIYKPNKGALEITMEAIEDFPLQPLFVADEYTIQFVISSDILEYYIDKFQNVVGKDELRPVMQGICLHHTSDNKLFLAGTDANMLLKVNITEYVDMPVYNKDMKFIIQPKRLYDFLNSTENTALTIKSNSVATSIKSDNWSFYSRNIDGNFPNYEAVIPREATKLVRVGIEPIKKAFNSESIKTYIKETDKKLDVIIFNKEDEIFIAKSEGRYGSNPFELKDIEKLCETNVDFTFEDYYNDNKNVLLIMPYGYDKQTNFAFRKDLVDRVFKIINSNTLDLHYNEMNRAYLIPIDSIEYKTTTKEHKVREQKPSLAEVKLVSTINEVNEIKEAIETLEMLLESATRKDKKEIKEAIEVLEMLLDTYEY